MADFPVTPLYTSNGVNNSNAYAIEVADTGAVAMANNDTMTITVPAGTDKAALPHAVQAWGPPSSNVVTRLTTLGITSHNTVTGVTVLTATGAVAAHSKVIVAYQGN